MEGYFNVGAKTLTVLCTTRKDSKFYISIKLNQNK
jgi:hypothetical protein